MEKVVVIEVVDTQGVVVERFKATKFPVRIGRAYDNDLIIADPYVCPHHCEMVLGEAGEIIVNDLSSVNGTFAMGEGKPSEQVAVAADSRLRIGHTVLHFKLPGQAVEATRVDTPTHSTHEWPPRSLPANIAVLLVGALLMTLWDYLDSYTEFEYGHYFFSEQIPAAIFIAGWAAIWSMVSRITTNRFAFLRHATILVSLILAMALSNYILEFLQFGFAVNWPFEVISIAMIAAGLTLLLYWHLQLCSDQKHSRLVAIASAISVLIVGLVQVNNYLDSQEFHSNPAYQTTLKPPAFQLAKSKPVDDFLNDSEKLRKRIDQEIDEPLPEGVAQASADSRPEK